MRKALSSFDSLIKFHKENDDMSTEKRERDDDQYDLDSEESDEKFNHYARWTFK